MSVLMVSQRDVQLETGEVVSVAERVRRASACSEMAEVLRYVGKGSSVPDVRWMTDVAVEELLSRARELQSGVPQN